MALVDLEIKNDIAVARMNNGVTNAISPELIAELSFITDRIQKEAAAIKENQLETIREKYLARVKPKTEQFMDLWFTKETQKRLSMAMEKF